MTLLEKTDLREEIIQNSRGLFEKQGYAATTVRQIAKMSGCTAGSLYYFFEGGKVAILQEVVQSYGIVSKESLSWISNQKSLDELIDRLVIELPIIFHKRHKRLNWLMLDLPHLGMDEMEVMQKYPLSIFESTLMGIKTHVKDPQISLQITWLILSTLSGFIEFQDKIGSILDKESKLEDIGETLKIAIQALINQR